MNAARTLLTFLALGVASPSSIAGEAPLAKVEVFPNDINLTTARDRQSLVVQATYADGITRDVTSQAVMTPANPALVRRDGFVLSPVLDGETTSTSAFGGQTVKVPLKVAQSAITLPLSFRLDVMPVFMRTGCNTGSCHGAARGKDGFRISLFGFDPEGDHFRLTREMVGRRLNTAVPRRQHDARKIDRGRPPHRRQADGEGGRILHDPQDLDRGRRTHDDVTKLPKVLSVELYPRTAVLDGEKSTQQMIVRARYSDGTDRDVTSLAVFLTNNETSAAITPNGLVTAGARGEAFVMARFETHTVGSQILVLPKGLKFEYPSEPDVNYVDALVAAKLKKLRIAPSELCTDEVFLRRAISTSWASRRPSRSTAGS